MAFKKELAESISDGREYFVKVFPIAEDRQIRGYEPAIVYSRQAFVALRKWQDAELYEYIEDLAGYDKSLAYNRVVSIPQFEPSNFDDVLPVYAPSRKIKRFERVALGYGDAKYNLWQRKE